MEVKGDEACFHILTVTWTVRSPVRETGNSKVGKHPQNGNCRLASWAVISSTLNLSPSSFRGLPSKSVFSLVSDSGELFLQTTELFNGF